MPETRKQVVCVFLNIWVKKIRVLEGKSDLNSFHSLALTSPLASCQEKQST